MYRTKTAIAMIVWIVLTCFCPVLSSRAGQDALPNVGFDKLDDNGVPAGWGNLPDTATVKTEEGNTFVRITLDETGTTTYGNHVELTDDMQYFVLSARIRTKDLKPSEESWKTARISPVFVDANGKLAGQYLASITLSWDWPDPRLWSPEHPNLYTLRLTAIGGDAMMTMFLRIRFDEDVEKGPGITIALGETDAAGWEDLQLRLSIGRSWIMEETLGISTQSGDETVELLAEQAGRNKVYGEEAPELKNGQWYNLWLVVDNDKDEMEVYIQGKDGKPIQLLDLKDADRKRFGFSRKVEGKLSWLIIRTGANVDLRDGFVDDIYIAEGKDLSVPEKVKPTEDQ